MIRYFLVGWADDGFLYMLSPARTDDRSSILTTTNNIISLKNFDLYISRVKIIVHIAIFINAPP